MTINLKAFLARQLNDHSDSPSGVIQKTFYEWTEGHISDAIELAICYVYSLLPQEFSKLKSYKVIEQDCLVNFCNHCERFVGIASLSIDEDKCVDISHRVEDVDERNETNSLSDLLDINCVEVEQDEEFEDNYFWSVVDGSKCLVKFNRELPIGSEIRYLCATTPDITSLDNGSLSEYKGLIADYALWWLFRTDSESRSNLARASLHFEAVRDFVQTKLLIEFSLKEDDYSFARRKVDD